jgi:hypothetical protein
MRISRNEVTRRNEVAVKFFKENPEATGQAFNAVLKGAGEKTMALKTVYALRDQARAEIGWAKPTDSQVFAAAVGLTPEG